MARIADGGGGGGSSPVPEPRVDVLRQKVAVLVKESSPELSARIPAIVDAVVLVARGVAFNPLEAIGGGRQFLEAVNAELDKLGISVPPDLGSSIASTLLLWLQQAFTFTAESLEAGLAAAQEAMTQATAWISKTIAEQLRKAGLVDVAAAVEGKADFFALLGALEDVIVSEDLLVKGPLDFAQILAYEDRISGIRLVLIAVSYVFHIAVEAGTLGQVEGPVGLMLHLLDGLVNDYGRVVQTQLVRRAVADPLADGFLRIHRVKDASSSELEEAYREGAIDDERYVRGLADQGFTDDAIQVKMMVARVARLNEVGLQATRIRPASASVLEDAVRKQWISPETFMQQLGLQGYNDTALAIYWNRVTAIKPEPGPGLGLEPGGGVSEP